MRTACGECLLPATEHHKLHRIHFARRFEVPLNTVEKLCHRRGRGNGRGGDRNHNRQPSREAGKDDIQQGANAARERPQGGRGGNKEHGPGKGGRHGRTILLARRGFACMFSGQLSCWKWRAAVP